MRGATAFLLLALATPLQAQRYAAVLDLAGGPLRFSLVTEGNVARISGEPVATVSRGAGTRSASG